MMKTHGFQKVFLGCFVLMHSSLKKAGLYAVSVEM